MSLLCCPQMLHLTAGRAGSFLSRQAAAVLTSASARTASHGGTTTMLPLSPTPRASPPEDDEGFSNRSRRLKQPTSRALLLYMFGFKSFPVILKGSLWLPVVFGARSKLFALLISVSGCAVSSHWSFSTPSLFTHTLLLHTRLLSPAPFRCLPSQWLPYPPVPHPGCVGCARIYQIYPEIIWPSWGNFHQIVSLYFKTRACCTWTHKGKQVGADGVQVWGGLSVC